ncbi:toll-like receptor 1 [Aplochiton taeniatus]
MKTVTAIVWAVTVLLEVHQCTSSAITVSMDLSSKNLSTVPKDLPLNVEWLDLSLNRIRILSNQDFQNTSLLRFLNISWNALEDIHPEAFRRTPLLEDLDLSHNGLQNMSDQAYLRHAEKLKVLDVSFNRFATATLGGEFLFLAQLQKLALGALNISAGDFKNMAVRLQTLTLSLEHRVEYESGSLTDVQANRLRVAVTDGFNMVPQRGLLADALAVFMEVELIGLNNGFASLTGVVKAQGQINTTHLYLSRMTIFWYSLTELINALFHSSIAHMSSSDITILAPPLFDTAVSNTSNMQSFTVRRSVVTFFLFDQKALYNFFINMPVESLSFLETSIIHMTCPRSPSPLRQVDFSDCALTDTVFSRVESQAILECRTLAQVETLILKGNNLRSLRVLSMRTQFMGSLVHLDLSSNSLTYDGPGECLWPLSINRLNLSSNSLTESVFRCLPDKTTTLALQNNQISTIPTSLLKLLSLSSLDLSANRLRDLPPCDGFPNLNVLLLRENSLHAPLVEHLNNCPHLKTLDASQNPFTCTCALRGFKDLGAASEQKSSRGAVRFLDWPHNYRCSYPQAWRNHSLEEFSLPEVSCNVGLLVASILCPALAGILGMVALCQQLDIPWYMGMIWQWTRAKHHALTQQVKPEDLVGVEFHAFVSYSQHDADWVKQSLLPNLEGPAGGLHVCRHERDFVPGKTIVENIIRCVEKSRRCVFVLSAHFVRSEWCHYELYFASHQRLSRGSDSVILVLLEPLPQYLIPSKYYQLKAMMSRHTYLEWPQDRAKHRLFWANLRAALQTNLPKAPVRDAEE